MHRRVATSVAGDLTTPREPPRELTIQQAELQTGREGDQILVVVGVDPPSIFPECTLEEGRTTDAQGNILSRWFDDDATETVQMSNSVVYVFHEDPHPIGKVADPRNTAYLVGCLDASSPGKSNWVKAHVDGTPGASP